MLLFLYELYFGQNHDRRKYVQRQTDDLLQKNHAIDRS